MPDEKSQLKQYNVQLPADLVGELKREAHRLTGHKRRGFSDLLAACASHGWEAYKRGELSIERQPRVISYHLVRGESQN